MSDSTDPFMNMFYRSIYLTLVILGGCFSSLRAEDPQTSAEIDENIEQLTKSIYETSTNPGRGIVCRVSGTQGRTKGGWPKCTEDVKFRFIRLDHGGEGWDDGMGKSGADTNFLQAFAKATKFKVAKKGESHAVGLLSKYPDDGYPPFIYLTGNGSMGRVNRADTMILREYCLKGGMLIGDAGSVKFHQSFLHFMRQVFPDKKLVDIADDDMIYQQPYGFPNGAPAFWHHGGRRPMGIKHNGRWCVFYHPGDMNDAWKSKAFTEVTPEMRDAAMHLGINLVYYSFNQWNKAIQKKQK
jgi:hypothetical protein